MSTKTGVAHTAVAASTGMGKAIGELKPLKLMPLKLMPLKLMPLKLPDTASS